MPSKEELEMLRALPLEIKVLKTKQRIREWYYHFGGNVVISYSGGKDSTVLAHLVHEEFPDVPLVFSNTGLEYPEIQAFAKKMGAEFIRPKLRFDEVVSKYGYPLISKEVAEAIYFARRIVPLPTDEIGNRGGGTHNRQETGTLRPAKTQERVYKRNALMSTAERKQLEFLGLPRPLRKSAGRGISLNVQKEPLFSQSRKENCFKTEPGRHGEEETSPG